MHNSTTSFPLALSLSLTGFLGEFSFALTTFGTAIIFQLGWQISYMLGIGSGNMSDALVNLSINEVLMATSQSLWLLTRKEVKISWKFVANTSVWICGGVIAGVSSLELLVTSPYNVWLKRSLGLFLLIVAGLRTFVQRYFERKKRKRMQTETLMDQSDKEKNTTGVPNLRLVSTQCAIAVAFFSSGFLGGVFGVAGPPLMIYVLYYSDELEGAVWRTTCAVMRSIFSIVRLIYLVGLGEIGRTSHWIEFGSMILFGLIGLSVGNFLSKYLKDTQFQQIILVFLICGSVLMITSGWVQVQQIAMIAFAIAGIIVAIVVAIAGIVYYRHCLCPSIAAQRRIDQKNEIQQAENELTLSLLPPTGSSSKRSSSVRDQGDQEE